MNLKTLFSLSLISLTFLVNAQYTNHESLLFKSSKFNITKYNTYNELKVSANFKLIKNPSKTSYLKSTANEQTIKFIGKNIGRIVIYSRLLKKEDSLPHNGELRIRAYKKNIKKPILTLLKSFKYDTSQEFHYNFTSPNIDKVELTYNNESNNFWVIEKLKLSELNKEGISVYKNIERSIKERQNLRNNWRKIRDNDELKIKKAIEYIRNKDKFVSYIENKLDTDELESTRNNLYNPTNNTSFDTELNEIFKNASISNAKDFKKDYDSIKKGNWNNALMNVDEILTGGKFQSLLSLVESLFGNGKYKSKGDDYIYTKLNKEYYIAKSDNEKRFVFKPITNSDNKKISLSKIKKRQNKIEALQKYVLILRQFQLQDLKKQEKYKSQIVLAKNEMQKLKSMWVNLVVTIDSSRDYKKLEKMQVFKYKDNDVLGPMSKCETLEDYERYFNAISIFDKKIKNISSRLQNVTSNVKNFNDEYYINIYRDIENQIGRISIINKIKNLPNSISNQFEKDALRLQNKYQDKVKRKFQDYTTITYSE